MRPFVFADATGAFLGGEVGQPVGGDRRRIHEDDRAAVRFGFALRELEQVQRALDVDLMRRDGGELGAGREERRKVEDELDLKLRQDALEHAAVENRSGDLAVDLQRDGRIEPGDVERDDSALGLAGQPIDEAVSDLAAGAGDEYDGFAHARIIPERSVRPVILPPSDLLHERDATAGRSSR